MCTELSNGIVVLDKPADWTSAKVVAEVKKLFGAEKCGHAGTLDPFATGVLVCCINQATRLAQFFLHGSKTYEALLRLGTSTDTQDFTGRVIASTLVPDVDGNDLNAIFKRFEGPQLQQPPVYSALKHNGTPLYKLARKGNPIQKAARPVTIEDLRIKQIRLPDILFQVTCSAGTYIRTLCADIGNSLGCGGHLAQLRRVAGSGFSLREAITLDVLKEKNRTGLCHQTLIPMTEALRGMPMVAVDDRILEHIRHGRPLSDDMVPTLEVGSDMQPTHPGYIKVVDDRRQLRAILQRMPGDLIYNYCCVFH